MRHWNNLVISLRCAFHLERVEQLNANSLRKCRLFVSFVKVPFKANILWGTKNCTNRQRRSHKQTALVIWVLRNFHNISFFCFEQKNKMKFIHAVLHNRMVSFTRKPSAKVWNTDALLEALMQSHKTRLLFRRKKSENSANRSHKNTRFYVGAPQTTSQIFATNNEKSYFNSYRRRMGLFFSTDVETASLALRFVFGNYGFSCFASNVYIKKSIEHNI